MHLQRNLFFCSLLLISSSGLAQQSGVRPSERSPTERSPMESKPTSEVKADPQRQALGSVQWASRVVGVSSEKKGENYGEQYKAIQALGRPNKLPDVGESPCAWAPFYVDGTADEWIQVGFAKPMRARQIVVAENVNAGSIVKVIAIDEKGTEHIVYETTSNQPRKDPILRIFPKDSALVCQQVKVVINGAALKGLNQIDGIGISDELKPIAVSIIVAKDIPKEIKKENLGKTVNSIGQEVAPVISPDGRTLYFT
ncbi:MAG: flagellar motor protein MotB, partial [Cytophagaceae bacterium]